MATTSKGKITELLSAALGGRHFSVWTYKEQAEALRQCGIASSKCANRTEAATLLQNLHNTDLPLDHLQVLRLIADFGLPPSGARSKQQFAYYLVHIYIYAYIGNPS